MKIGSYLKKVNYLNKMYEKNPKTGNYIIQIGLEKYTDIFNDWDHASFKKRDMDPDLVLFLENCSEDIPLKYEIDVCFYLPKEIQDKSKEKTIATRFKTYYYFYMNAEKKALTELYEKVVIYIIISFVFLMFWYVMPNVKSGELFYNTLSEGVNIGGWVFLWEAISLLFFKRREIIHNIKVYKRLAIAKVYFKYNAD